MTDHDVMSNVSSTDSMAACLVASGPSPDLAVALALYGQLVGSWDVTNRFFVEDPHSDAAGSDEPVGAWHTGTVVWTFGWVLAGLAVQDVMWFTNDDGIGGTTINTGSTMRLYDRADDLWHVVWFGPSGRACTLIGRPGPDRSIVQEGTQPDGRRIIWSFTELTGDAFRWLGHISDDDGVTWRLEQEMLARRRSA